MTSPAPKHETQLEELARALNLLPYFLNHPDATVLEAAHDLGRPAREIQEDLIRLTLCGRGDYPEELVELSVNGQYVDVNEPQGMVRPLRLTRQEAVALLLSLESLASVPGLADPSAVTSAAEKLREHTVEAKSAAPAVVVAGGGADRHAVSTIREALTARRTVCFSYYSASGDSLSRREVSPAFLFTKDDEVYLTALHGGERRTFRVDRMADVTVGEAAAAREARALRFNPEDPFELASTSETAYLGLHPDALWLTDYYPITLYEPRTPPKRQPLPEGWAYAKMPVGSSEWLVRFVLSQGDRVRLRRPVRLAEACAERASAGLAAYA